MEQNVGQLFSYAEFTQRNRSLVTEREQRALRRATVFVCGVGGTGQATLAALARAGVGRFIVADVDRFEVSNLNRQAFASLDTIGLPKAEAAAQAVHDINPEADVEVYDGGWEEEVDAICSRSDLVVAGLDDRRRSILLWRKAAACGRAVLDSYFSPLPSVIVARPGDPRMEERLHFPSVGRDPLRLGDAEVLLCRRLEIEYVLTHSSTLRYVELAHAVRAARGTAPVPSWAPTVLMTGNLIALEAAAAITGRKGAADHRGYFFNPWVPRVERPRGPLRSYLRGLLARRLTRQFLGKAFSVEG